jgi:hypothetical protein
MRERTLTLEPAGEGRYVTADPDTDVPALVVMVHSDGDDDDGPPEGSRPAYVHFGGRAHARIA